MSILFLDNLKEIIGETNYSKTAPKYIKTILDHYPLLPNRSQVVISGCVNELVSEYCRLTGTDKILLNSHNGVLSQRLNSDLYHEVNGDKEGICYNYHMLFDKLSDIFNENKNSLGFSPRVYRARSCKNLITTDKTILAKVINSLFIQDKITQDIDEIACFEVIPYVVHTCQISDIILSISKGYGIPDIPSLLEFALIKQAYYAVKNNPSDSNVSILTQAYTLMGTMLMMNGIVINPAENIFVATIDGVSKGKFNPYVIKINSDTMQLAKTSTMTDLLNKIENLETPEDMHIQESESNIVPSGTTFDSDGRISGVINHTAYIGDDIIDNEEKFRELIFRVTELDVDTIRTYIRANDSMPVSLNISGDQLSALYVTYPDIKKVQTIHPERGAITIVKYKDIIGVLFTSKEPNNHIYMIEIIGDSNVRRLAEFSINTVDCEFRITSDFKLPSEDGGEL